MNSQKTYSKLRIQAVTMRMSRDREINAYVGACAIRADRGGIAVTSGSIRKWTQEALEMGMVVAQKAHLERLDNALCGLELRISRDAESML